MFRPLLMSGCLLAALAMPTHAATNIWFIVDASGSMAGRMGDTTKMAVAKQTLRKLIGEIDPATRVTLLAYGHRRKNDCDDIDALTGMMTGARDAQIAQALQKLKPLGKTPIARSLLLTGMLASKKHGEDSNAIVLISDGIETCSGDPCQVAGKLANANVSVRTHVIGFGISGQEQEQLKCIARLGKGKYFAANSVEGFARAVKGAIRVAQAQTGPKAPPPPQWREVFRDDFGGDSLNEHWSLSRPDPDAFVVEDGKLTLLVATPKKEKFYDPVAYPKGWSEIPNTLRLNTELPQGEWRATVRFSFKPQTFGEWVSLALTSDDNSKVIASTLQLHTINYATTRVLIRADKVMRSTAGFTRSTFTISDRDTIRRARQFSSKVRAVELRLQRKGREYITSIKFDKINPKDKTVPTGWITLQKLSSLRPPGKTLSLFIGSFPNSARRSTYEPFVPLNTENTIDIEWIRIEVPKDAE